MLEKEIKEICECLEDKKRFFCIDGDESTFFYDSYTQSLYGISKKCLALLKSNFSINSESYSNLEIEDYTKILNFISTVHKNKKDQIIELQPDVKCTVMINTSNRCNLNCNYCYRNKAKQDINSLETVKNTIEYAMKRYKPEASEFVFSYSMTSESSVDLPLLKSIANEYINYENYQFYEDDIVDELKVEFFNRLRDDFQRSLSDRIALPETENEIIDFLNSLLEIRNLFDVLKATERMFNDDAKWQIQKRESCTKWKLYRINRWCLEVIYDKYLKKRHVPYVTFWFMTNGTSVDKEYIDFVKACDINPLWVSIDGPKDVHDYNRKFGNNIGSYDEIVKNINIFKQNNINLKGSAVLTAHFPKPFLIIRHLLSLGFKEVAMTPVRPGYECSFNEENIWDLCDGYDEIYEALEDGCLRNDFSLFKVLREDLTLSAFNIFISRTKLMKRCSFDDQIVVNAKGEIYPCLYFTDNKEFCLGNIKEGLERRKLNHNILVNQRSRCSECWARYLCGGTCFYGSMISTGNYIDIDKVECILKKHLAENCLKLIVFMKEHNISISQIYN